MDEEAVAAAGILESARQPAGFFEQCQHLSPEARDDFTYCEEQFKSYQFFVAKTKAEKETQEKDKNPVALFSNKFVRGLRYNAMP